MRDPRTDPLVPATADTPAPAPDTAGDRAATRAELARGVRLLLAFGDIVPDDAETVERPRLGGAVRVPLHEGGYGWPAPVGPEDLLYVDHDGAVVWSLTPRTADDPRGGHVARRQPLTALRAELVLALRVEYEAASWSYEAQVGEPAARLLIEAGWHVERALRELGRLALRTQADALVFLGHDRERWAEHGWLGDNSAGHPRMAPLDAVLLIEAGIDAAAADRLHRAGFRDVQAMLAARPPAVPHHWGRILLAPDPQRRRLPRQPVVTTTRPDIAEQWLRHHPDYWWDGAVTVEPGVAPLHVEPDWTLWDDHTLTVADWATVYPADTGGDTVAAPVSTCLSAAAVEALGMVARHADPAVVHNRASWAVLCDAIGHTHATQEHAESSTSGWIRTKTLYRHTFRTESADTVTLWELHTAEGGLSGGEGDHDDHRQVWMDEAAAYTAYVEHTLTPR